MISSDSENSWIILNNTHEKSKTHIIWKPKETVSISVTGVFVLYALNRKSHISKRKHQFHVQLIEFQSLKIWIRSVNSAKREMNAAAAAKKNSIAILSCKVLLLRNMLRHWNDRRRAQYYVSVCVHRIRKCNNHILLFDVRKYMFDFDVCITSIHFDFIHFYWNHFVYLFICFFFFLSFVFLWFDSFIVFLLRSLFICHSIGFNARRCLAMQL